MYINLGFPQDKPINFIHKNYLKSYSQYFSLFLSTDYIILAFPQNKQIKFIPNTNQKLFPQAYYLNIDNTKIFYYDRININPN